MAGDALLICPEAPYPTYGGGALRTAAMLHYLAQRYNVFAVLFRQPEQADPRAAIPQGLVADSLTVDLPHHRKDFASRALRNAVRFFNGQPPLLDRFRGFDNQIRPFASARRYDVAVVEHFWCAPYLSSIRAAQTVVDLHNIESVWHHSMSGQGFHYIHRRFAGAYRKLEQALLPRFDLVLTASAADQKRLPAGIRACVYPNTIPDCPLPGVPKQDRIVFSANLEYQPNRAAVAWFVQRIWPSLKQRCPTLKWVLAGRGSEAVSNLVKGDPRITLTGPLDDLTFEIASAKAAVVPIHAGSGTRIKILEAWRAGTAVVSTSLGAEGLPGEGVVKADTPDEFLDAVQRVVENPAFRQPLERSGRHLFEREFTWEAGWKCLEQLGF